ncbi:MAG: hypothetical protein Q3962_06525 [Corynebacterium sp.]|nr:hypothetical protein [Corynebacterium sp.]
MADIKKALITAKRPLFGTTVPNLVALAINAVILAAILTGFFYLKGISLLGFIPAFIVIFILMCLQSLYISPDGELGGDAAKRAMRATLFGLAVFIIAVIVVLVL